MAIHFCSLRDERNGRESTRDGRKEGERVLILYKWNGLIQYYNIASIVAGILSRSKTIQAFGILKINSVRKRATCYKQIMNMINIFNCDTITTSKVIKSPYHWLALVSP